MKQIEIGNNLTLVILAVLVVTIFVVSVIWG